MRRFSAAVTAAVIACCVTGLAIAPVVDSSQAANRSHPVCEVKQFCDLNSPKLLSNHRHDRFYPSHGPSLGGVLLVHGGAFYLTLLQAWGTNGTCPRPAEGDRCGPHAVFTQRHLDALEVDYPVSSVGAELRYVEKEARWLKRYERSRPVYAYGESAGGDLVGMLAVRREVTAAAVNAPEGNLLTWPTQIPGFYQYPGFWQTKVPLSLKLRRLDSPTLEVHGKVAPLLVEASHGDSITPFTQGADLAMATDGTLVVLKGNHLQDPTGPPRAAKWLADRSWLIPKRRSIP